MYIYIIYLYTYHLSIYFSIYLYIYVSISGFRKIIIKIPLKLFYPSSGIIIDKSQQHK